MATIIRCLAVAGVLGAALVPGAGAQWPPIPASPAPVQRYEYDATGNLTRATQVTPAGGGLSTQHLYDTLNRRTQTRDALGGMLTLSRTARDDISAIFDPIGARTSYDRDGFGSVLVQHSPDTGTTSYAYDATGRLTTRTDARGVVSAFSYDAMGRLIAASHGRAGVDTQVLRLNYDEALGGSTSGVGYLTSMSGPATFAQFFRDVHGRVIRHLQRTTVTMSFGSTATDDLSVDYGYDGGGNLVRLRMPSGRVVYLSRSAGKVQSIAVAPNETSTATTLVSQIRYEPFGPIGGWLWHNGSGTRVHDRIYDAAGRMVRHPIGTLIRDIRYDAADRIQSYVHFVAASGAGDPIWDQSFAYDGLGRLSGMGWRGYWRAFGMDANGNRLTFAKDGLFGSYTMQPASNRMLSSPYPNRSYGYDAAGNPTVLGLPLSEIYPSGQLAYLATPYGTGRYTYDAMGRRVIKAAQTAAAGAAVTATTTLYVYDIEHHLLGEYAAGGGVPQREYVWLDDVPLAMLETDPTNPSGMPRVYFVHTDHLDAPRVLVDRNGVVRWRWIDEPFGAGLAEENPSGLGGVVFNLRMPGQVFDVESRLHYNFHRYYDPTTGRYTQSDPIGLQGGTNTYGYAFNQPTKYTDPNGLFSGGVHYRISREEAFRTLDCSREFIEEVATQAVAPDWIPASGASRWNYIANFFEAQSASRANEHGMSTQQQAANRGLGPTWDFINRQLDMCTAEGLGRALHAAQDVSAASHGLAVYNGNVGVHHLINDYFPAEPNLRDAREQTRYVLNRFKSRCSCPCGR